MSGRPAALVRAPLEVREHDAGGIVTTLAVTADEPLFAGHYPDFPIFPGVALVDCGHRSALAAARLRGRDATLEAVETARFLRPVFPGDVLTARTAIEETGDRWRCSVELATDLHRVATLRLRYAVGVPG